MKKTISTIIILALFVFPNIYAQQYPAAYPTGIPVNKVRTWTPRVPIEDAAEVVKTDKKTSEVILTTQYTDGLGRSLQTVVRQGAQAAGSKPQDLVSPVCYDEFGRESKQYLPFASSGNIGEFKYDAFQQDSAFYKSQFGGVGEKYYYAQTDFEAAPFTRVEKQMAPGNSWVGSNKGTEIKYRINTLKDSIRIWNVTDATDNAGTFGTYNSPASAYYAAGMLRKTVTVDEHGKQAIEYTDKSGKTIVMKLQAGTATDDGTGVGYSGWICTYYIYDDLGNLRCVVQPEGVKALAENGWQFTATILDEQCFRYEYNYRNLPIMKKTPGVGAVYFVYDKRDRQVMMQDANMRGSQWFITRYDYLNRPVKTGIAKNNFLSKSFRQLLDEAQNEELYPFGYSDPEDYYWETYTITHYDDYNDLPKCLTNGVAPYTTTGFINKDYNTASTGYAQEIKKSDKTKGKVAWKQVRRLGVPGSPHANGRFIYIAYIYDDNGNVIQSQRCSAEYETTVNSSDIVVVTTQYDWAGKPLYMLEKVDKDPGFEKVIETLTAYSYDDLGRIASIKKKVTRDGISAEKVIVKNEYNALGQLKYKTLAPDSYKNLESLTYDYNIRGWLLGINRDYAKSTYKGFNYFGFDLGYDSVTLYGGIKGSYASSQLNGNIAGMIWKSKGDNEIRKYDFTYDAANRLTGASFNQYTGESFNKNAGVDFSVSNLSYDNNGNILTMNQVGVKPAGNSALIDQLKYSYETGSNKLKQVTDAVCDAKSTLGDFKYDPATKTDIDFQYDANGNMTIDNNKKIARMDYNYLNQLNYAVTSKGDHMNYYYDADGNKLEKTGGGGGIIDYLGNVVFENNQSIQFINDEEGRIRPITDPQTQKVTGFAFDYFLRDHLGNVRMVLTDEQKTDIYPAATLEGNINTNSNPNAIALEKSFYDINTANVVDKSQATGIPNYVNKNAIDNPNPYSATTTNSAKLYKLQATSSGGVTGLGFVAKVMSGDKVNIFGKSYYFQNNTSQANYNIPVATILTGLLGGNAAAAGKTTLAELSGNSAITQAVTQGLQDATRNNNGTTQTPKAYINYILFDEQFKAVKTGFSRVGTANTIKDHYTDLQNIPVDKNGYLYVYVSNESPVAVFFDNLQVTHERGRILSEDHYYPFGLTMQGISSAANSFGGVVNRYKFNGGTELGSKEFSDGSGGFDFYETNFRSYNAQLGRFMQNDLAAEKNFSWSNYSYVNNNPLLMNDPLGLWNDSIKTDKGDWAYSNNDGALSGVTVSAKKKKKKDPWEWDSDPRFDEFGRKVVQPSMVMGAAGALTIGGSYSGGVTTTSLIGGAGGGSALGPFIATVALIAIFDYCGTHRPDGSLYSVSPSATPQGINGGGDIANGIPTVQVPDLTAIEYPDVDLPDIAEMQGKGERGQTGRADGTDNPFKKLKPDPNKPGKVLEKDSHSGRSISKPAPPGFWDYWNSRKK